MQLVRLFLAAVIGLSAAMPPATLRAASGPASDSHHPQHEDDTLRPDIPVDVKTALSGNTIFVLAYRSFAKPTPGPGGASSLDRLIFQAWLREDGVARLRVLDGASNLWRNVAEERWSVDGDVLCLTGGALQIGLDRLCLDTLVFGQVFTAATAKADIIVKGNWRKGNALGL